MLDVDTPSKRHAFPTDQQPADPILVVDRKRSVVASQVQFPPSPIETDMPVLETRPASSHSVLTREEDRITRKILRGAPGDAAIFSVNKTPGQNSLARRKSQYYGEVFAYREPNSSARERISRESIIMADIKTNVIIQNEYTFITDLSYSLSTRYQRPESSILVTVSHSACLLFGGSFEPAYTMSITALSSQLQPVTNKRNAALISKAMEEGLGVTPNRGLIKFIPISEENLSTDGKTVAGEIEELEKERGSEDSNGLARKTSRIGKAKKRQSLKNMRSLRNLKASPQLATHEEQLSTHDERMTPPLSERQNSPQLPKLPEIPTEKNVNDRRAERAQKVGRRKSFIATIFGK